MPPISILYDGWHLLREPESPAALHLWAILTALPDEIEPLLALPEPAPDWLPRHLDFQILNVPDNPTAHRAWEQRRLPAIARQTGARLLHLTTPYAPLSSGVKTLVSPTGFREDEPRRAGFAERLRAAMGQGGLARANGVLWPEDQPPPRVNLRVFNLPPFVHPDFAPVDEPIPPDIPGLELPENYVLYHGPGSEAALRRLLASWTYASGPVGAYYPLLLLGLDEGGRALASKLVEEYGVADTARLLPRVETSQIPALYRGCAALYHTARTSPWGGPLRHALACARPVVALETPGIDVLVGDAAYLIQEGDIRGLGAAFISVVVKDQLVEQLSTAAKEKSAGWRSGDYGEKLLGVYKQLID